MTMNNNESMPLLAERSSSVLQSLKFAMTSSIGFMADGYDFFVVDVTVMILSFLYPDDMTAHHKSFAVSMSFAGVIIGQLGVGVLADVAGRKTASMITAVLMLIGCILSALCVHNYFLGGIAYQMGLCRFALGLGIGGEYPVSAAMTMEAQRWLPTKSAFSQDQRLVVNMVLFALGGVLAQLVFLAVLALQLPLDICWRVALVCGAVPSVVALALRALLEEPEASEEPSAAGTPGAAAARYLERLVATCSSHGLMLAACCVTWLLQNVVCLGFGSFKSLMNERMFPHTGQTICERIRSDVLFGLILSACSTAAAAILLVVVERVSIKWTEFASFILTGAVMLAMGLMLSSEAEAFRVLLALMCIWGGAIHLAGTCVFVVPARYFPEAVRGSCFGLAAASGKAGALAGTAIFPFLELGWGLGVVQVAGAVTCFAAAGVSSTLATGAAAVEGPGGGALGCPEKAC